MTKLSERYFATLSATKGFKMLNTLNIKKCFFIKKPFDFKA